MTTLCKLTGLAHPAFCGSCIRAVLASGPGLSPCPLSLSVSAFLPLPSGPAAALIAPLASAALLFSLEDSKSCCACCAGSVPLWSWGPSVAGCWGPLTARGSVSDPVIVFSGSGSKCMAAETLEAAGKPDCSQSAATGKAYMLLCSMPTTTEEVLSAVTAEPCSLRLVPSAKCTATAGESSWRVQRPTPDRRSCLWRVFRGPAVMPTKSGRHSVHELWTLLSVTVCQTCLGKVQTYAHVASAYSNCKRFEKRR